MYHNILADECVDFRIIKKLRESDYKVVSIMEDYLSLSDDKILDLATKMNALLITEDSDFGEWIFSHHKKSIDIIFLRYKPSEINEIMKSL